MSDASRYERLRAVLVERAEHYERDAEEADLAGNSHRGHDVEAAIDLHRAAARLRARAAEFRAILREDEEGA